jgi:hypothetical protein
VPSIVVVGLVAYRSTIIQPDGLEDYVTDRRSFYSYDSGMTQEEYRDALTKLGYSRREWGRLTDTTFRAIQKRAAEGTAIPGAEAALLELLLARPELKL